ncbi:microfibrillar-associated protein 2-like isoform X2 [Narcine bancroftii]|uniref:microfibrillar-associated protein 2-like isoform X2 n=1 Tax=Narcine bancroftii TaxID=1343680 RepID=UPI003831394A
MFPAVEGRLFQGITIVLFLVVLVQPQDTPDADPTHAEPFPQDCHEEQYLCTRLYSIHQPRKQCFPGQCIYSLRRMYVVNKEICVRTVCLHEEDIRAELCRSNDRWPMRSRRVPTRRERPLRCPNVQS